MSNPKIPTPITDKNGKATTVWRKVEPAYNPGERIAAAARLFGKKTDHSLSITDKEQLFTVVQRLRPQSKERFLDKTGFDAEFSLDNMGRSEFEWGATKESLNRMRQDSEGIEILTETFNHDGMTREIHFVGTNLENKVAEFQKWLDEGAESLEATYFTDNFNGTEDVYSNAIQAWWSLSGDIAWTLDEDLAERLVTAITPY